jgi:transcriptional regulator with GAF, ATPase, and Fis domain
MASQRPVENRSVRAPSDVAEAMSRIARSLEDEQSLDETLRAVVLTAVGTVPGAEHAGVSLIERRREIRTRASTGELPTQVDQAQYDAGEGPCLTSAWEQTTVWMDDVATEARWPEFARRARRLGLGSSVSFQLFVRRDNLGALNLYATRPHAFARDAEHVGLLFAAHASVALAGAQREDQLRFALGTRDAIGTAKGILMERYGLDADAAFRLLVRASQQTNLKLRELAQQLVATGKEPWREQ